MLDERVRLPDSKDLSDTNKALKATIVQRQAILLELRNKLVHFETQLFSLLLKNPSNDALDPFIALRQRILEARVRLKEKNSIAEKIESEIASFRLSDLHEIRDKLFREAGHLRKQISVIQDPRVADLQSEVRQQRLLRDQRDSLEEEVFIKENALIQFNSN